jgi:hypothetical protein
LKIRLKPWQFLAIVALAIGLLTYGLQRFRYRFVRSNTDLVRLLPRRSATTFFLDVSALRAGHVLQLMSAPKTQEADYQTFVLETGFDYTRDLNAMAGNTAGGETYFLLKGRLDWNRLANYAIAHGGTCSDVCVIATTTPGNWASFRRLQPDVIALAVSTTRNAVTRIGAQSPLKDTLPSQPLWIRLGPNALDGAAAWPAPAKILANTLHSASEIVFSAGPSSSADLQLGMNAQFPSERFAETVRNQLEIDTRMLKLELARENQKPNPADLTGLLVSGAFQLVDNHVIATWPLRKEFLESLQIQ